MSIRKIDAYALMKVFRDNKPEVWEEDNGYDQGALDVIRCGEGCTDTAQEGE